MLHPYSKLPSIPETHPLLLPCLVHLVTTPLPSAAPVAIVGVGRVNSCLPGLARDPWLEVVRKVREDRIHGASCAVMAGNLVADSDGGCLHLQ